MLLGAVRRTVQITAMGQTRKTGNWPVVYGPVPAHIGVTTADYTGTTPATGRMRRAMWANAIRSLITPMIGNTVIYDLYM
jgi:hypothetical protein